MFKVKFNNSDEIPYEREESFIVDLFHTLISDRFSLCSLTNLQLNMEIASNWILDFLKEQQEVLAEKKKNIVKTVSKEYKREIINYQMHLLRLIKRISALKKQIIKFIDVMEFKQYILGFILSVEGYGLLKGFSLSDNLCHTDFGNAEQNSWTNRRRS